MSEYGAYGYAQHGKGYRFILGHYYTGTTLGTVTGPRIVRVLLDVASGDVGFSGATSACGKALDPSRNYEAHRDGIGRQLRSSGGQPLATCGRKLRAAGAGGSRSPASAPTAARWRSCRASGGGAQRGQRAAPSTST